LHRVGRATNRGDGSANAVPANDVDVEMGSFSRKDTIPHEKDADDRLLKPPPYSER